MRTKRMISFLLALVMVLAVVPNFALADNEETQPAEAVTYTVTFDANGGTAVSPVSVEAGATVAAPQIVRDGYELIGWYTTAVVDGQSVAAEYDFSTPVTSDLTLQAQWSAIVPKNIKMSSNSLMTVLGAPSAVAKIGDTGYPTLEAAVAAAQPDATITLLDNAPLTSELVVDKSITLNLNGHNVQAESNSIKVMNGSLNVVDNSTGSKGVITGSPSKSKLIYLMGSTDSTATNYSNLTIGEGVTVLCTSGYAIMISKNETHAYGVNVTVNGTVEGSYGALYVNGTIQDTIGNVPNFIVGSTATLTHSQMEYAIYAAGYANWTVNGGAINGGMEAKAGNVTINGGTFTAKGEENHVVNGDGASTSGYALAAVENKGYAGHVSYTVNGGTFIGKVVKLDDDSDTTNNTATIAIKGGTFSSAVPAEYCANGYIPKKNDDGTYGVKQGTYFAQIVRNNEVVASYETLAAAVEAATAGDTVKLLTDVTLGKISDNDNVAVSITKSITLDGDNHILTTTATRGIWIDAGNVDVKIKNLTITGNVMERAIQVNPDLDDVKLTIDHVTATSSYYTVNICGGVDNLTMNITNSTLTGWAALNLYGAGLNVTVEDSVLHGINKMSNSASNNFGTIVLEGDTTGQTTLHSHDYNLVIRNSTITATSTKGNTQSVILHNAQSANNWVTLDGCTITWGENGEFFCDNSTGSVTKVKPKEGETLPVLTDKYGYSPVDEAGYYTINGPVAYVCNLDGTTLKAVGSYGTLQKAFTAAEDGQWVYLIGDVTQDDGILFNKPNAEIVFYMAGHTLTVNKGENVNNRAIRIDNGTLEVFGGTIVAVGSGETSTNGAGCYGAFRVEANGELIAHDLTLTNARPWGLNVKVLGGKAELTNVTINSSYGGGIEVTEANLGTHSQAGQATLTDCTFTQENYFDHCSTAISVSGGSKVTVNGGSYTGERALYVFSSGGEIKVKGGTFTGLGNNGREAIVAAIDLNTYPEYTGGLKISGGKFTGTFNIQSPAYMTISGGYFTADPQNYLADGYDKKKTKETGYVWEVGEHIHNFTNGEPNWLWTVINGTWSASSTYTGTCKCGVSGTETLTATVVKTEETDSVIIYTATDENGKKDTKTFQKTFTVTYGGLERTYLYGAACKLESGPASDWKVNGSTRAVGTAIFYFPVTENATVTSTVSTESTQQATSNADVQTSAGKMVYHFTWSIPEGSQVVSAVIYRCRDDNEAIKSFEDLSKASNLRTYDTKMYVRNGEFTYTVTGLSSPSKQTIMFHLVYTLDGQTCTMNTDIQNVDIP